MPRPERPLDDTDNSLARFATGLRLLREKAGKPTYRELSTRAHYSAAALSEAAGGRKLPSLAVTLAFVGVCGGDVEEWEAEWRDVSAELSATSERRTDSDAIAPYAGLGRFEIADAERFFGRDALVGELVTRVRTKRVLGVFGASGAGKSSVLRAGLLAKLAADGTGLSLLMTPGTRPFEACAVELSALSGEPVATVLADLEAEPRNLHLHAARALASRPADAELVLVVDQFEEVFTQCDDPDERDRFVTTLVSAALTEDSRVRLVLGARADFYAHCGRYPELAEALRDAQVLVGPMNPKELREAVAGPATGAGLTVETELVSRLVADTAGQLAVLPLLSHALLETWRRRAGITLTLAGYEKSGGIQHSLAKTADEVYANLEPVQQQTARELFLRLIALGDGTEDTKRRLSRRELDTLEPDTTVLLDELVRARLLTVDRSGVELAHEALIRHWPRLREWVDEDREGLLVHRQLTEAADGWERLDRDPGALYRGIRLSAARERMAGRRSITAREREFLDASFTADRRGTRRLRQLVALLGCLVLAAGVTTVFAVRAQQEATQQRDVANAQNVVGVADAIEGTNPALAAQLRLSAYRLAPDAATTGSLLSAFSAPYSPRLEGHTDIVSAVAAGRDGRILATGGKDKTVRLWDFTTPERPKSLAKLEIGSRVLDLAVSPDSRTMTVAHDEEQVDVWSLADPAHPVLLGSRGGTESAWSPDGKTLAVFSRPFLEDEQILLVPAADPVHGPVGRVPAAGAPAFGPDSHLLAVPQRNSGDPVLWDITDPAHPQPLETPAVEPDRISHVSLSPDGKTLATGKTATLHGDELRLWDVQDPRHRKELARLPDGKSGATAAFGRDGRSMVAWGALDGPQLWDLRDLAHPRLVRDLPFKSAALDMDRVNDGLVSRDGRWLVSAGDTLRLTDLDAFAMDGLSGGLAGAAFVDGGRRLVAGAEHGGALTWDVTDPVHPTVLGTLPIGNEVPPGDVRPSSDGKIAVVAAEGKTRLWDMTASPPKPAGVLDYDVALGMSFSADGRLLATGLPAESAEGPVDMSSPEALDDELERLRNSSGSEQVVDHTQLWDVTDVNHPQRLAVLRSSMGLTVSRAFSTRGNVLATANTVGIVALWDISDPRRPKQLENLTGQGSAVAAGPDGLLALAGPAGTAQLWSADDGQSPQRLGTLSGHNGDINLMAFGPDGRRLVTSGEDGTSRLWDIEDVSAPKLIGVLTGHKGPINGLDFSPDGHTVVTNSDDKSIRLWETDPERVAARICATAYPRLTEQEWGRYLPAVPFQQACS